MNRKVLKLTGLCGLAAIVFASVGIVFSLLLAMRIDLGDPAPSSHGRRDFGDTPNNENQHADAIELYTSRIEVRSALSGSGITVIARGSSIVFARRLMDTAGNVRWARSLSDDASAFQFAGIQPGEWDVWGTSNVHVKSRVREGETTLVTLPVARTARECTLLVRKPGGEGCPNADISLGISPNQLIPVGQTDPAGRFSTLLEGANWYVAVSAAGFRRQCRRVLPPTVMEVVLASSAVDVHGIVVDAYGRPVENAEIQAGYYHRKRSGDAYAQGEVPFPWHERTGEDGTFVLGGLDENVAVPVWVSSKGFAVWEGRVVPGWEAIVRIEMTESALVRGRVTQVSGVAACGVRLQAVNDDTLSRPDAALTQTPEWIRPHAMTDENGEFTLEKLRPGRVRIYAQKDRLGTSAVLLLGPGEAKTWNAVLGSRQELHGSVRGPQSAMASLVVWARDESGIEPPKRVDVREDGTFTFKYCFEVPYLVTVHERNGCSVATVFPAAYVEHVFPRMSPITIEIEHCGLSTASVYGTVIDEFGAGVGGMDLYLEHRGQSIKVARTEASGRFLVGPLSAGEYLIASRFGDKTGCVSLGKVIVGQEDVDTGTVTIQETGELLVEAREEGGLYVSDYALHISPDDYAGQGATIPIEDGHGVHRSLPEGHYTVRALALPYAYSEWHVGIHAGQKQTLQATVRRGRPQRVVFVPGRAGNAQERNLIFTWRCLSSQVVWKEEVLWQHMGSWERIVNLADGTHEIRVDADGGRLRRRVFVVGVPRQVIFVTLP